MKSKLPRPRDTIRVAHPEPLLSVGTLFFFSCTYSAVIVVPIFLFFLPVLFFLSTPFSYYFIFIFSRLFGSVASTQHQARAKHAKCTRSMLAHHPQPPPHAYYPRSSLLFTFEKTGSRMRRITWVTARCVTPCWPRLSSSWRLATGRQR